MDKETSTLALVIVTALVLAVVVSPLIPAGGEKYSEIGVLGPSLKIGGYPTSVAVDQQIRLFVFVGNHQREVSYYQVLLKAGNQSTVITNSTSADLPTIVERSLVLADNKSSTIPVTFAIPTAGLNQRVIFELWSFDVATSHFSYTGLWNQVWINVTGS